jgi:hypothetical protein
MQKVGLVDRFVMCTRGFTVSKDWHHASKDRSLLCTDCRIYFKKYGEVRPVTRAGTPPPYLFRPLADPDTTMMNGDDDGGGVKTRGKQGRAHAER